MKVLTLSVVVGDNKCNARCPYCVSRMTPKNDIDVAPISPNTINWHNFHKACRLAMASGATTALLTGKGEPTLYPDLIEHYLKQLNLIGFPIIELQTNGIQLAKPEFRNHLERWHELGLNTIALSIVSTLNIINEEIVYGKKTEVWLSILVDKLHRIGFSVRLSLIMLKGYVDSSWMIYNTIRDVKNLGAEQLTLTPVNMPDNSKNTEVLEWVRNHQLEKYQLKAIKRWLDKVGTKLMTLPHGAIIYDVDGQNVCLSNCLTKPVDEDIRQLIFFPDGHLYYDWQYPGAIIF